MIFLYSVCISGPRDTQRERRDLGLEGIFGNVGTHCPELVSLVHIYGPYGRRKVR